jgi:hypothetical protein
MVLGLDTRINTGEKLGVHSGTEDYRRCLDFLYENERDFEDRRQYSSENPSKATMTASVLNQ